MNHETDILDTAASAIQRLMRDQSALQAEAAALLHSYAPEKHFKGREYVAAIGEVYAKLLLGGRLEDETHEHDLETLDGKRYSIKTRVGGGRGWAKSSAIPSIDSPDGPTGLVFVLLNENYTPRKIWVYDDWNGLKAAGRFKSHIVRGQHRSFVFFVSERSDNENLRYFSKGDPSTPVHAQDEMSQRIHAFEPEHWSTSTLIPEASDRLSSTLSSGQTHVTIDLEKVQDLLLGGDSPAYKIMEAMYTVRRDEGMDGFRGAPRILGALIQIVSERCATSN